MPGPPPDPNAKRRNAEGEFSRVVRDPDRKAPEFPLTHALSVSWTTGSGEYATTDTYDITDDALAYWRAAWCEMGGEYGPMQQHVLARAAIEHGTIAALGADAPGTLRSSLARHEATLWLTPAAQRAARLTIVAPNEAQTRAAESATGAGHLEVVESMAARFGRAS
jgi:hypothetical protein